MLAISPEGVKLLPKGERKGHEHLISGQTALAVSLNASLKQVWN
jgi:hypothetical protein